MEAKKRILIRGSAGANANGLKSFDLSNEQQLDPSKVVPKKFIARGAYGSVYRGRYEEQDVAIKVLDWGEDDQSMETLMLRKAFRDEVTVWCDLDHANISKFVGATLATISEIKSGIQDEPKNVCCLVTEFQRSGTLRSYLRKHREKKLNLKTVVRISLELAKGLSYLHSEKVVHRDIKPENILLNKEKTVKICDFGVARPEASNQHEIIGYHTMKKSDSAVVKLIALNHSKMTEQTGTIGYMAPEVFAGEPYTRKCDVYSFGICLWEIYCCDMAYKFSPFDENTYPDIYKSFRPDIPSGCPKSLANLMKRCWETNPNERPEMEEVVSMLEAIDTSRIRWFGCFS